MDQLMNALQTHRNRWQAVLLQSMACHSVQASVSPYLSEMLA
jgi:hypothetical protein